MVAPTPQTASTILFDKLRGYVKSCKRPDEFTAQTLRRDAEKLIASGDPVEGYMALGGLAAIVYDVEKTHYNHKTAIRLSDSERTRECYAISLQLLGFFDDASEQAKLASELEPENISVLQMAIKFNTVAGRLDTAKSLVENYLKRVPGELPEEAWYVSSISTLSNKFGITTDEINKTQQIAFDLLREREIRFTKYGWNVDTDLGEESIQLSISVPVDADTILDLESEFTDRVFEAIPHPHLGRFVLGYEISESEH